MKIRVFITCIIFFLHGFAYARGTDENRYSDSHFAMGTVCTITLFGTDEPALFRGAFDLIDEIESKMSVSKPGSEVGAINARAGVEPVEVSAETFFVVEQSLEYSEISGGKFDITVQPLVDLWGIGTEPPRVPDNVEIAEAVALIGSDDVELDRNNKTVYLRRLGMAIDLGGIAKGYAADLVEEYLRTNGMTRGILNFGGNIIAFGDKPGDKPGGVPWVIGIQDPFDSRGVPIGTVELAEGAVVTSGIYERYFEYAGRRYHHILDPDTGYPVDNELVSITIIGESGIEADAFSTLIFALGARNGADLLESIPSIEGIFITKELDVYITSGIRGRFSISNQEYHLRSLSE